MKKQKVTLQQVVCAVLCLSQPEGCSCSQISKFCSIRYGIRRNARAVREVAEKAVDQGILVSFRRKYRLAPEKPKFGIVWLKEEKNNKRPRRQRAGKGKGKKGGSKRKQRKRTTPRVSRGIVIKLEKDSSLFKLWCKEKENRELMTSRKIKKEPIRRVTKARQNSRKSEYESRRKTPCKRVTRSQTKSLRRSKRIQNKINSMKENLRSKQTHCRKRPPQNEPDHSSRSSKCSSRPSEEFHKQVMKQVKNAVTHAKSWDRINQSLMRNQRENQELMKDSKLVQKILSNKHGKSWDNLNSKLRQIKEKRSCSELGEGEVVVKKHKSGHTVHQ